MMNAAEERYVKLLELNVERQDAEIMHQRRAITSLAESIEKLSGLLAEEKAS